MRLKDVSFRYARRSPWILHDVSVDLEPGRIVEFSGANGAGKSTLLRLIAGLLRPRRGEIDGRPAQVAYAPERFPSDQPFTVAAYLGFMTRMRRLPDAAAQPWIERLGLSSLLDVPLPKLSKGSAQKVGLAQALSSGAGLLVLDEPFAGLDAPTGADVPGALGELAVTGTTIVVSDHQGCLAGLPHIDRHRVENRGVSGPLRYDDRRAATEREKAHREQTTGRGVTLEIVVAPDEAEAVVAKLRADGHQVRRVSP
jgi:ABC-type multidrug transport system ATPase subunit